MPEKIERTETMDHILPLIGRTAPLFVEDMKSLCWLNLDGTDSGLYNMIRNTPTGGPMEKDYQKYIEKAIERQDCIDEYDICKEV